MQRDTWVVVLNCQLFFHEFRRVWGLSCLQALLLQLEFELSLENNRETRYKIPFLTWIHPVFWVLGTRRIFSLVLSLLKTMFTPTIPLLVLSLITWIQYCPILCYFPPMQRESIMPPDQNDSISHIRLHSYCRRVNDNLLRGLVQISF